MHIFLLEVRWWGFEREAGQFIQHGVCDVLEYHHRYECVYMSITS